MSRKGFTLIELIVSVGIFTVVITIAASAYLSMISLDRRARALNDVVTNLSFAVDVMSRSIRTGGNYNCGGTGSNCPAGANNFSFIDEDGTAETFLLRSDNTIGLCVGAGVCNVSTAQPITDPRISISRLTFYTEGVGTGDGKQPRVIFTITGSITPDPNTSPVTFTIEGASTERQIEL